MDMKAFNKKYMNDADFRAKVNANPREALIAEGAEFPEGMKVKLVTRQKDTAYVFVPSAEDHGLSDEELGSASGGIVAPWMVSNCSIEEIEREREKWESNPWSDLIVF